MPVDKEGSAEAVPLLALSWLRCDDRRTTPIGGRSKSIYQYAITVAQRLSPVNDSADSVTHASCRTPGPQAHLALVRRRDCDPIGAHRSMIWGRDGAPARARCPGLAQEA